MSEKIIYVYEKLFREIEKGCGDFEAENKLKAGLQLLEQFCVQEKVMAACPKTENMVNPYLSHLIGRQIGFLICNGDYFIDFSDPKNWYAAMDEVFSEDQLLLIAYDLRLPDDKVCLKLISDRLASLYTEMDVSCRDKLKSSMTFEKWQSVVPTFECFFDRLIMSEAVDAFRFILEREDVISVEN